MKNKFWILLLCFSFPLLGEERVTIYEQNELEVLQELIKTTEQNLTEQKKMFATLLQFKRARTAFIKDPTSAKLATKLVKCAMLFHNQMEKEHLTHLFSSSFVEEVAFFHRVGKQQLPRS